jgi:hypothetical protein
MKYYLLYVKLPDQKRFRPVDWNAYSQVRQRIHATMFKEEAIPRLKEIIQEEVERKGRLDGIKEHPWDIIVKWDNIQWELRQC